jgi:hypothetical protein
MSKRVKVGNHSVKVPGSVLARRVLGSVLIAGGLLGFLPVVGFWMLPLGLLVLVCRFCVGSPLAPPCGSQGRGVAEASISAPGTLAGLQR